MASRRAEPAVVASHGGVREPRLLYTSADGVARFAAVAEALGRGGDVAGVARDALRLAQLGELLLGRDAPRPRPRGAARLPADVFASPGEALTVALRAVGGVGYNLAGSEAVDFAADRAARTAGGAALKAAYDAAAAAGLVTGPKVVFDESLPAGSLPKLKELVASLGGTVAGSAEGATHLLATDPPPRGAMPDETYGRVAGAIECASGAAIWRVHWMYTPDSHDEWVTEVEGVDAAACRTCVSAARAMEAKAAQDGPVVVPLRWLLDSADYNEWANAYDYRPDAAELAQAPVPPSTAAAGAKRAAGGEAPAAKRVKQETAPTAAGEGSGAAVSQLGSDIVVTAGPQVAAAAGAGGVRIDNLSEGQLSSVDPDAFAGLGRRAAAAAAAAEAAGCTPGVYGDLPPRVGAVELYRVPAYAAWFEYGGVGDIERTHLPEFFNGRSFSKTTAVYKQYRNHMIDKFREDPTRRVTFTECRRELLGDVSSMLRVYQFLQAWGLINYGVDQTAAGGARGGAAVGPLSDGATAVAAAAARAAAEARVAQRPGVVVSGASYVACAPTPAAALGAAAAAAAGGRAPLTGAGGAPAFATAALVSAAACRRGGRVVCNATGVDCTTLHYVCAALPDYDLCPAAFRAGKLPPNTSTEDFVAVRAPVPQTTASASVERLEAALCGGADDWTASESLQLLDALEAHGDDWEAVAAHVGTRTRQQCLAHFLRLPLDDEYMRVLDERGGAAAAEGAAGGAAGAQAPASEQPAALDGAANPVMAQMALLVSMVGPKVAAAAASAALQAMAEEDPVAAAELQNGGGEQQAQGDEGPLSASQQDAAAAGAAPSAAAVKHACAAGLAAAAVRAKLLADAEEREMQRLVTHAVEAQLKKVEAKMKSLEALTDVLCAEREQVAAERRKLMAERVDLAAARAAAAAAAQEAGADAAAARQRTAVAQQQAQPAGYAQAPSGLPPTQQYAPM